MKFGASSWPFQWDAPYEDAIRRVAGAGFKAIELIAWNRGYDFLNEYYTPEKIKDLKDVMASEGIEISQFVCTPHDLCSPDAAKRQAAIDRFKKGIEVGKALGSKIINSVSGYPFAFSNATHFPRITNRPLMQKFTVETPSGLDWAKNFQDYVAALRTCCENAHKADMIVTIEPHPFAYASNTAGMLRLLEHVNSPALGINFDPSHTFPMGDFPNVSVYQLGSAIKHLHVSDNDGATNVHWRPGMGKIDWKAMLQALKDIGYDGVISVELEDVPGVSRGASDSPGLYRHKTATDEFVAETVAGADYLKNLCREVGITVQ